MHERKRKSVIYALVFWESFPTLPFIWIKLSCWIAYNKHRSSSVKSKSELTICEYDEADVRLLNLGVVGLRAAIKCADCVFPVEFSDSSSDCQAASIFATRAASKDPTYKSIHHKTLRSCSRIKFRIFVGSAIKFLCMDTVKFKKSGQRWLMWLERAEMI